MNDQAVWWLLCKATSHGTRLDHTNGQREKTIRLISRASVPVPPSSTYFLASIVDHSFFVFLRPDTFIPAKHFCLLLIYIPSLRLVPVSVFSP